MSVSEITLQEATRLCARADTALHGGGPVSDEDLAILRNGLETWAQIGAELMAGHFSLKRLREIYGIEPSEKPAADGGHDHPSETQSATADNTNDHDSNESTDSSLGTDNSAKGRNQNHPGHRSAEDVADAPTTLHKNSEHPAGSRCSEQDCRGHVYPFRRDGKFRSMLRVIGGAPLRATCHEFEDMRCNACGKVYEAPADKALTDDGPVGQMYGYSAMATIALYKYLGATPWNRQTRLQQNLGFEVSPSVQWDQCEGLANVGRYVQTSMINLGALGRLFYADDAKYPILSEREGKIKQRRGSKKEGLRSGMHTSCVIAELGDKKIVLFKTGILHAGEWMDDILKHRPPGMAPPFHMADRSSSNSVTAREVIELACNAHPRNDFDSIKNNFKCACGRMLDRYKKLYKIVRECDKMDLHGQRRLEYLKVHATPIVDDIFGSARQEIAGKYTEPNSGLGKLYAYLVKHEYELRAFLRYEDVPLDNNLCEAMLGKVVALRNNAWFYKNEVGAWVSDVIMSLGQTAILAGVNPYEYFVHLLRNQDQVRTHPENFLPWNFQAANQVAA